MSLRKKIRSLRKNFRKDFFEKAWTKTWTNRVSFCPSLSVLLQLEEVALD